MIDNPSFETSDLWGDWMDCAGFAQDEGTMIVQFRTWSDIQDRYPEAIWPSAVGAVPIYRDGWTSIGLSWSADGKFTTYINSHKRPWWAVGILFRLWMWRK